MNTLPYGFWRGSYRGCTGSGDMYGLAPRGFTGTWFPGVFSVAPGQSVDAGAGVRTFECRGADVLDGLSNTLMISEGIVPTVSAWGGPLGSHIYGNMGGALFTTTLTPNSTSPDRIIGPCPANVGDVNYKPPCQSIGGNAWWTPSAREAHAAARSFHPGGVNAGLADGSVRFYPSTTDMSLWRALGTRTGGEPGTLP
jgi:prepilin-type processing-associated H-X9-DG protein